MIKTRFPYHNSIASEIFEVVDSDKMPVGLQVPIMPEPPPAFRRDFNHQSEQVTSIHFRSVAPLRQCVYCAYKVDNNELEAFQEAGIDVMEYLKSEAYRELNRETDAIALEHLHETAYDILIGKEINLAAIQAAKNKLRERGLRPDKIILNAVNLPALNRSADPLRVDRIEGLQPVLSFERGSRLLIPEDRFYVVPEGEYLGKYYHERVEETNISDRFAKGMKLHSMRSFVLRTNAVVAFEIV